MEKRQATHISPKNQNGLSCSKPGHDTIYSSEFIQKALHSQRFLGRSHSFLLTRIGFNFFYISSPLISSPNALFLNAWALFLTPMLSAPYPHYYHEFRNHISGSLYACAMTLNWEKIFCYIIPLSKKEWENYSREEKNVQKSNLSGGNDWIEWGRGCPGNVRNFKQQHER